MFRAHLNRDTSAHLHRFQEQTITTDRPTEYRSGGTGWIISNLERGEVNIEADGGNLPALRRVHWRPIQNSTGSAVWNRKESFLSFFTGCWSWNFLICWKRQRNKYTSFPLYVDVWVNRHCMHQASGKPPFLADSVIKSFPLVKKWTFNLFLPRVKQPSDVISGGTGASDRRARSGKIICNETSDVPRSPWKASQPYKVSCQVPNLLGVYTRLHFIPFFVERRQRIGQITGHWGIMSV